ncbi:hypothetical protein ACWD5A_42230, partial [Streptomyces sp. NPDC002491]
MSTAVPPAAPLDGLRFAFGTLTVLPVRVTRWDRPAARAGMLSAPLVGLVVGGCAAGRSQRVTRTGSTVRVPKAKRKPSRGAAG